MSVEKLRERIRKTKNPAMIDLSITTDQIPDSILSEQESVVAAIHAYGKLDVKFAELSGIPVCEPLSVPFK